MLNFREIFKLKPEQVAVIVAEIEAHSDLWTNKGLRTGIQHELNPFQNQYEIILRFNDPSKVNDPDFDWKESVNYPPILILRSVRQYVYALAHTMEADRIGRSMITNLPAGATILPHADVGYGAPVAEYYDRYHLSLKDNPGTVFRCGDEHYRPEPGQVFWFNNSLVHEVINNGDSDRWTLIVDLKKPTLLAEFVKKEVH